MVLAKEKFKENDGIVYILTKNYGVLKCITKGLFKIKSKNLSLLEVGNFNRFFILTNLSKFKIVSALPLKTIDNTFKKSPYLFLWTLKIIKNLQFPETPKFIWFILLHLESYLNQNSKNFPFWFLFHILRETGYEINLNRCVNCNKKLKNFAFFDNKKNLYCFYCRKKNYQKINKKELEKAQQIKNLIKIPLKIPNFLKVIIKNSFTYEL